MQALLAKSVSDGRVSAAHTLRGHTALVVASAHELLEHRGAASLAAAGLDVALLARLRRIVLVAAYAHDLGKCSDHFQAMVRRTRDQPQLLRHEAATLWIAWPGRPLGDFLQAAVGNRDDLVLSLCAAAGHHRKFWSHAIAQDDSGAGTVTKLLVSHPDFAEILSRAGAMTGLRFPEPPVLSDIAVEVTRRSHPRTQLEAWEDEARSIGASESRLLAIAKALVLDADVAGSALPKAGEKPAWISNMLGVRADRSRLEAVVRARLGTSPLRPFQREVAGSSAPVTIVRAGCGTGKTAAAYQWAADQHPGRQLWVTYPTTGTATEGFRDYAHNPSLDVDLEARLDHGRAVVDLEIFGLLDDDDGVRDRDRLDALRNWGAEVVTCTVDTVLGLVQNNRKGLYAWAGLAHAAVVFDEIHAYDEALFGALLRFLEALPGVPALLMTASLPAPRMEALRHLVLAAHSRPLAVIDGPEAIEALPRYLRVHAPDPWTLVEPCLSGGGKVLWVSNTVDRCLALSGTARSRGMRAMPYHSRFRYRDRVDRHGDVIDAFRMPGAAFATTTQVAEMSLDLSADLLVTDLAPIPSMIQRLGRLNRRSTPEDPSPPKPFVVLDVASPLPYDDTQLAASTSWLAQLGDGPLSQRQLVDAWPDESDAPPAPVASCWLDGGFNTDVASVREGAFGITVLLPTDAERIRRGALRSVAAALPMGAPRGREWQKWPRLEGYPVPPDGAIEYDPERGARWR